MQYFKLVSVAVILSALWSTCTNDSFQRSFYRCKNINQSLLKRKTIQNAKCSAKTFMRLLNKKIIPNGYSIPSVLLRNQDQRNTKMSLLSQHVSLTNGAKFLGGSRTYNVSTVRDDSLVIDLIVNNSITQGEKVLEKREAEDFIEMNGTIYNDSDYTANNTEKYEELLERIKEFIFPKAWTWVLIFLHSAVFLIGLVGNTFVCVAVYRNHTMRTVTNYFIVNLAVADFLVILLCLPPTVIWDVTMTWFLGTVCCKIVLYLQTISVTVSILTLTFISVDRWYAICFPLKFESTTGRAKTAIAIIWLVAMLFDIPELVVYRTVPNEDFPPETIYFTQCEPDWSSEADRNWMIIKMILLYAIPLIFMTFAYCQIIRVLWKSGNVHQHSLDVTGGRHVNTFTMNTNTSTERQLRSRRKAAKMLVAVVVMFAVCYFPIHLLSVIRAIVAMSNTETNRAFFLLSHWLCYFNSAVNPIIYNFMSGKFRKEFGVTFTNCSQTEEPRTRRQNTLSATYVYRCTSNYSCKTKTENVPMETLCTNEDKINM